jgi:hypothetical protein
MEDIFMSENTARVVSWLNENNKSIPEYKLEEMYDDLLNDIYEEVDITELGGEYWHVDDVEEAEEAIEAEDAEEE